ncbi:RimK family alpha-L-glutamate ligase [Acidianus ambivalens]|uniref:RimK family alpha-L-glutamate ligase n=1 Tax=Acidianus ambivalens TaxID=2283 RepID=A0A650CUM9_ACIAM|nr:RimK family alpha-L-glutamate ligase [Acidianus ambivalens]MQL55897.1 RimK family alpha-L-glutamate ligase [Acidianus ambivalens]QGR21539.1 RimK family alpha-L-glutamate ligase [Acidianus ambivalens]
MHESQKVTEPSKELLVEIRDRGHTAYYIRPSKLNGIIDEEIEFTYAGKKISLDGGIIRNLGFLLTTEQLAKRIDILIEMEKSGVVFINNPQSVLLARDKFESLMKLNRAGVPVPPTAMVEDPFEVMRLVEKWGEVVIKPVIGSLGLGSVRASDPDIAFRIAKAILSVNQPVYVQKYVKKPDRDIRAFVVGDRLLGSIYRISQGSWKTNVAQGAVVQVFKPSSEIEELSLKATKVLGLDYAGIDIVEDLEGGLKILEVNAAPLWKGFSSATHINPAKYIVEYLIQKIKK